VKIENPIELVRMLKGAPLSVLFSLMLARRPMGELWLTGVTGYSRTSIWMALKYLVEVGLIQRNDRCEAWVLTGEAQQLPLMPGLVEEADGSLMLDTDQKIGDKKVDPCSNIEHGVPTAAATTTIEGTLKSSRSSSRISDPCSKNEHGLLELLKSAGIGEPKASQLCRLDWMTLDYAQAHIQKAKEDGIGIGLLIHRMWVQDAAPQVKRVENEHEAYIRKARESAERLGLCLVCLCSPCVCSDE